MSATFITPLNAFVHVSMNAYATSIYCAFSRSYVFAELAGLAVLVTQG